MGKYLVNDDLTKSQKKLIDKYSVDIPITTYGIRGTFTITNYRNYRFFSEIEVEFKGLILVTFNHQRDWYDSTLMIKSANNYKPSKIKVNRYIKKHLFTSVKNHLSLFCIDISYYSDIKKLTWK